MYFGHYMLLSFMLWTGGNLAAEAEKSHKVELFRNAMNALYNGLQYFEDHMLELNLDGVFGCRLVEALLQAFLESDSVASGGIEGNVKEYLEILAAKAGRIADIAKRYVKRSQPMYYAALGAILDRFEVLMWYPGRLTKPSLIVKPLPCSQSQFNETFSDQCLKEIVESRKGARCHISKECVDFMTLPRKRGYMLTHQMLYFQVMELENCVTRSRVRKIPGELQDTLCSNVMRDTLEIAESGYPMGHRDLFMEQIGLCGIWGYKDFYKPHWLENILQWQQPSGCYTNRVKWYCTDNLSKQHIRSKREEALLKDGCLSHKTTVALLAIATNIRFLVEEIYELQ